MEVTVIIPLQMVSREVFLGGCLLIPRFVSVAVKAGDTVRVRLQKTVTVHGLPDNAGVYAFGGREVMSPENIEDVYRMHVHVMSYMGIPQIVPFPEIKM